MRRFALSFAAIAFVAPMVFGQADGPPNDLQKYIAKKDASYQWTLKDKTETSEATVYTLDQISQTWQGIDWNHAVLVVVPKDAKPAKTMLVWNQGGSPNAGSKLMAAEIAKRVKAPVAFLFGVPKQPLYNGKTEDALIAETFVKYLETGDSSWPLLFPMAKSLIRTMDTLQAFGKKEWNFDVTHFIVTGASKRGWTSWLTAASGDPRVKAIAPMVIDTLNFQKQMPNQLKSFNGKYSEMIHDYEERKLLPLPETTEARKLWAMVDPWVYRDKLTLPKLIINGTNDPYWAQDALNQYWDDLKGEKYVCYVANAGHGLRPEQEPNKLLGLPRSEIDKLRNTVKMDPFPIQAINTLSAFTRLIMNDQPMPKLDWTVNGTDSTRAISVKADRPMAQFKVWENTSETPDFRKSKWQNVATVKDTDKAKHTMNGNGNAYRALLGEAEFKVDEIPLTLSTTIQILEPKK